MNVSGDTKLNYPNNELVFSVIMTYLTGVWPLGAMVLNSLAGEKNMGIMEHAGNLPLRSRQ